MIIDTEPSGRRITPLRILLALLCGVLLIFWAYAIFFFSPNKQNVIGDKDWSKWAQENCLATQEDRNQLADYTRIDNDPKALNKRATLVEKATDGLEALIATLDSRTPSDAKGAAIVPDWIADYRTYIGDRRDYIQELRSGKNVVFAETAVEGVPISERLTTFADDNLMSACAPPTDVAG